MAKELTLTASELSFLQDAIWLRPRLMQHLSIVSALDDAYFTLELDATCIEEYLEDTVAEWARSARHERETDRPTLRALIAKLEAL
jgi:hypothetical protein